MNIPLRRCFGMVLGVLALLGPLSAKSHAQFVGAYGGGALGGSVSLTGSAGFGAGFGSIMGVPSGHMGYGSLMNGRMGMGGRGLGGLGLGGAYGLGGGIAGTLVGSAASGYGLAYGLSMMGTQWMMNPYTGYLTGAAATTKANAQYYQTIQQAKLSRQESIRSSLETRRAMIEEADWEREHMPDPEKIRQQALQRELTAARISPPLTEVWSAHSLNVLLRHLIAQQGEGVRGPAVPLNADTMKHINVTAGDTRGNLGLLKQNGDKQSVDLEWPESLQGEVFKEGRERLNELMKASYKSVKNGSEPSDATLNDLLANYRKMQATLNANVKSLTPDAQIEANRYLGSVKDTITALQDPNVVRWFNEKAKGKSVAELVRYMREKGLRFAPATAQDEAAYVALYHALAAFDAGMQRVASTSGNNENK